MARLDALLNDYNDYSALDENSVKTNNVADRIMDFLNRDQSLAEMNECSVVVKMPGGEDYVIN
jgi:hypothetical protein